MPVVKVGRSRRVTIPKAIWEKLALQPGDSFAIEVEDDRIVLIPMKSQDEAELWYRSAEGQAEIQRALEDVRQGRTKEFEDVEDLIRELNS